MKHILYITFAIFLIVQGVNGQESQEAEGFKSQVALPSSPEAAAFAKFIEAPVNTNTGIPSIGIPLHSVQYGPLSVPISLNYHAGGVKVDEVASRCGIGWSLSGGGSISRTVLGIPDESEGGFLNVASEIDTTGTYMRQVINGERDSEPDVFSFNLPGYSGKFYFDPDGEVVQVPKQPLKIEYVVEQDLQILSFVITDPQGSIYTFGNDLSSGPGGSVYDNAFPISSDDMTNTISTWHLINIKSYDEKFKINFEYRLEDYRYKNRPSKFLQITNGAGGFTQNKSPELLSGNGTTMQFFSHVLSKITTPLETVSYIEGKVRSDLNVSSDQDFKPYTLGQIKLNSGAVESAWNFTYDYFKSSESNANADKPWTRRLRLTSLFKTGGVEQEGAYEFDYIKKYNTYFLPDRFSTSVDYWGFYNGAPNGESGLNLPNLDFNGYDCTTCNSNRDISPDDMKVGTLNFMKYPTGGALFLDYEVNRYVPVPGVENQFPETSEDLVSFAGPLTPCIPPNDPHCCIESEIITPASGFSVADKRDVQIRLKVTLDPAKMLSCGDDYGYAKVQIIHNGSIVAETNAQGQAIDLQEPPQTSIVIEKYYSLSDFNLPTETEYDFKLISSNSEAEMEFYELTYVPDIGVNTFYTGGLRLKSSTISPSASLGDELAIETGFSYGAGRLVVPAQKFIKFFSGSFFACEFNDVPGNIMQDGFMLRENSFNPLTDFSGYHVLYESVSQDRSNGKTVQNYDIEFGDFSILSVPYPGDPNQDILLNNNLVLDSELKTPSNTVVQSSSMGYNNEAYEYSDFLAFKVANVSFTASYITTSACVQRYFFLPYTLRTKNNPVLLNQTTTLDGVTSAKSFTYIENNGNLFQKTQTLTNGNGDTYETTSTYSFELNKTALTDRNILIPLNSEQRANNNLFSGSKTEYADFNGHPYPQKIYAYEVDWTSDVPSNGNWDLKGTFLDYDAVGNPTKFQRNDGWLEENYTWTNGQLNSYTYGTFVKNYTYNGRYPLKYTNVDLTSSTFIFDQLGRLNKLLSYGIGTKDLKSETETTYCYGTQNSVTQSTTFTDADERKTQSFFDGLGRGTSTLTNNFVQEMDITTKKTSYDDLGRSKSALILPTGVSTETNYELSPLNRVEFVTNPTGITTMTYGTNGGELTDHNPSTLFKTTVKDEKGQETHSYTDILGRQVATIDAMGNQTLYTYYHNGGVKQIKTPELHDYDYEYEKSSLLTKKRIPGQSADNTYTYDVKDQMVTSTDPNGNTLRYEYDDYGRMLRTFLGNDFGGEDLINENFYDSYPSEVNGMYEGPSSGGILTGKLTATKSKLLSSDDTFLYSVNSYDEYGRVTKVESTNPESIDDLSTMVYNKADDLLSSQRLVDGISISTTNTFDTWGRIDNSFTGISGNVLQEYKDLYFPTGLLKSKNLGGLQSIDYTYNDRGWLRSINQDLGGFSPTALLPNCDTRQVGPDTDIMDPVLRDQLTINELLARRYDLDISAGDLGTLCEDKVCPEPGCGPVSIAAQIAAYETIVEQTINSTSNVVTIPCIVDGVETTRDENVTNVEKLVFPVTIHRIRLCDNTSVYVLEPFLSQVTGNYNIDQSIEVVDENQLLDVVFNGSTQEMTIVPFLDLILGDPFVMYNTDGHVECGEPECETYPVGCDNATREAQLEAIAIIKEEYKYANVPCEINGGPTDQLRSSTPLSFPITVLEVALCDGSTFWVTQAEWDNIMSTTGVNIVDTKIYESCDDTEPMNDLITPLDKNDLLCLQLDYEPNGNITNQIWQVAGRHVMKYSYGYDLLNRVLGASFSEHFSDDGNRSKTIGEDFSVSGIQYSAEGNIMSLKRNGVTGYCRPGVPQYGPIDDLLYEYDPVTTRLTKVTERVTSESGGDYGLPTLVNEGTYGYDANGNIISDPSRGITITYNHLNLPKIIEIGSQRSISYLYDASGVKWKKVLRDGDNLKTTTYINGVEYVDEEVTSIFLDAGRAAKTDDGWQMEYVLRDHLGNTRIAFSDVNGDGSISKKKGDGEVLQEHHIYPFGMSWESSAQSPWYRHPKVDENKDNNYQYNGKELQDEILFTTEQDVDITLGYYAYGARYYDPAIGRFTGVDPIADQFPHVSVYNYAENEPIANIDLHGLQKASYLIKDKVEGIFDYFIQNTKTGKATGLVKIDKNSYTTSTTARENAAKSLRVMKYAGITVGGILTTALSGGTGTGPYAAAFLATTGVYSSAVGVAKIAGEISGNDVSDIPSTPLGIVGRVVDEIANNEELTAQTLGEIANGVVSLGTADYSKWDALSTASKLKTLNGIVDGLYYLSGTSNNSSQTENYSQEILNLINQNNCQDSCNEDE